MKQTIIYALDFDGVICDSAVETAITGWKAAICVWDDFNTSLPSKNLIDQFRQVRPVMETGYEAILIMRLLYQGESVDALLTDYTEKKQQAMISAKKDIAFLKQLFGETRDIWINQAVDEWVMMNPLFPGIAKKLQRLNEQVPWIIITTKQERFVTQILNAYQIELPKDKIFGLERNMSKEAVLIELLNQYPQHLFHFVEDRLPTLLKIMTNTHLEHIKLFLATWGYNTKTDKQQAMMQSGIQLIDINDFLVL